MNHKNSDDEVIFDLRQFISDELSKAQISELKYTVSDYRLFRSLFDLRRKLLEYQTISHGKIVFKCFIEENRIRFEVYNHERQVASTDNLNEAAEIIYDYAFDLVFCSNCSDGDQVEYMHGRPTVEQFTEHYLTLFEKSDWNVKLFWNGWLYVYDTPFDELSVIERKSGCEENEPSVRTRKFRSHDITLIASVIYNHQIENGDL